MKDNFNVGDKVILRKSSGYYGGGGQLNDEIGIIIEARRHRPINVKWSHDGMTHTNTYSAFDLKSATPTTWNEILKGDIDGN